MMTRERSQPLVVGHYECLDAKSKLSPPKRVERVNVAVIAPRDVPDAPHVLNCLMIPVVLKRSARHAER